MSTKSPVTTSRITFAEETESMKLYLNDVCKFNHLSTEEEKQLILEIREGNQKAKNKFINANLKFVIKCALNFKDKGLDIEDLIEEGNIGLIDALEHFDINQNVRFITYAVYRINKAIMDALSEKSRTIRLPQDCAKNLTKIIKLRKDFSSLMSESEMETEIASRCSLSVKQVRNLLAVSDESKSLYAPVKNGDDIEEFANRVEDERILTPEQNFMMKSLSENIKKAFISGGLNEREIFILCSYYGLDGHEEESFAKIGKHLGIVRERVRQIKNAAEDKMRKACASRYLEDYLVA